MTINLSTRLFYDRSATSMISLTAAADRLTTQVSTGKRLLDPSDDSVAFQRLQFLARATADAKIDGANVSLAQSILQQADTVLGQITAQLQNASELVVQAGNGTLTPEAKVAIATQLAGIRDSIVTLANTRDARGGPLFGGVSGDAAVTSTADGSLSFTPGDASPIPIGDDQTVQPSANARTFLKAADADIGAALTAMIDALNAGGTIPEGAAATLTTVSTQTLSAQSSVGARAARVDIVAAQIKSAAADREVARSGLEDVDVTQAITDLQKTMTILSATQASFSKLSSLSLFDYLR